MFKKRKFMLRVLIMLNCCGLCIMGGCSKNTSVDETSNVDETEEFVDEKENDETADHIWDYNEDTYEYKLDTEKFGTIYIHSPESDQEKEIDEEEAVSIAQDSFCEAGYIQKDDNIAVYHLFYVCGTSSDFSFWRVFALINGINKYECRIKADTGHAYLCHETYDDSDASFEQYEYKGNPVEEDQSSDELNEQEYSYKLETKNYGTIYIHDQVPIRSGEITEEDAVRIASEKFQEKDFLNDSICKTKKVVYHLMYSNIHSSDFSYWNVYVYIDGKYQYECDVRVDTGHAFWCGE